VNPNQEKGGIMDSEKFLQPLLTPEETDYMKSEIKRCSEEIKGILAETPEKEISSQ
jgi:hypothetical protein